MFKLTKEINENNRILITITYNGETIFYKGFSEIGEGEIQLIKDQAFKDLLRVLNVDRVLANILVELNKTIDTLAPVVEPTLEQVLNTLDNNECITINDLNNHREALRELYEYYAHYENDLNCEYVFLFHSIEDVNYYIDYQFNTWSDIEEQFNYYKI
ncbi:MAG: hypothetical protein ACRC7S_08795 [Cetobacterium sp.]